MNICQNLNHLAHMRYIFNGTHTAMKCYNCAVASAREYFMYILWIYFLTT